MNNIVQNLVFKSPSYLRDGLISLYGLSLYDQRYGGVFKSSFEFLNKSQYFSADKLYQSQLNQLKIIANHALKNIPFYRQQKDIYFSDNLSEILKQFPIIDSSTLIENNDSLLSGYYKRNQLIPLFTSGSTGSPKVIYISKEARRMNYAFFERSKNWAGVDFRDRCITFAGRTFIAPNREKPPFWTYNAVMKNHLFSSYHISEDTIPYYVDKIKKVNPLFIDSYPSSLIKISEYIISNKINSIKPKAIITSSETLFDHHRNLIENAFNTKVFDQYGSTEQVVYITQCEYGKYHVNPEFGLLEVVDQNNNPVKNGEIGEFICTGFTNLAMPLIRYRIGDMGILSDENCQCGRAFPVVKKILGRNDDLLITPSGKYIGRLDPIFKGINSSISETQIIQKSIDYIEIHIVKKANYLNEHGTFIIEELKKRMGTGINYSIFIRDSIPRTKNGKFRSVINEYKSSNA